MPHTDVQSRILELKGFCSSGEKYHRLHRDQSAKRGVILYCLLCRRAQFSTHFTNCISISAFLWGTRSVDSGATISDCGPSAKLKVHWNCKDCTPRCWQAFFSSAGSNISGFACNWLAISDGTIATPIGTGDLILMLTCAPSWSGVNPPYTFRNDVRLYFSLTCSVHRNSGWMQFSTHNQRKYWMCTSFGALKRRGAECWWAANTAVFP